jgi:hypothetical protein
VLGLDLGRGSQGRSECHRCHLDPPETPAPAPAPLPFARLHAPLSPTSHFTTTRHSTPCFYSLKGKAPTLRTEPTSCPFAYSAAHLLPIENEFAQQLLDRRPRTGQDREHPIPITPAAGGCYVSLSRCDNANAFRLVCLCPLHRRSIDRASCHPPQLVCLQWRTQSTLKMKSSMPRKWPIHTLCSRPPPTLAPLLLVPIQTS